MKGRASSDDQIFAWHKEVRARLIADLLSIDPVDRRQHAGKIALHSDIPGSCVSR
jgi:hypothetical protein